MLIYLLFQLGESTKDYYSDYKITTFPQLR